MPDSCRAPGCKAGYKPRKKKRKKDIDSSDSETDTATVAGGEKLTLFSFRVILCFENEKIPNSHVNSVNKESMNTCTTLNRIFNYLDSIPKKQVTDEEILDDII